MSGDRRESNLLSGGHPPNPDGNLVAFLRQHCPPPPAAAPDLEDRLWGALAAEPPRLPPARPWQMPLWRWGWLVALAAVALGIHSLPPARQTQLASTPADLETYFEELWSGAIAPNSNPDSAASGRNTRSTSFDPVIDFSDWLHGDDEAIDAFSPGRSGQLLAQL